MSRDDGAILWDRNEVVATALIDRPSRRNALSATLCDDLRALLEENRDLRAVVIGGTGNRAFCSGADLTQRARDVGGILHGGGDTFRPAFDQLLRAVVEFPAPVVAAVNGAALGAGMQLAVACDLRVVAPRATFGIPAGRLGVLLSAVNVERLARVVGQAMARDVLLTARVLDVEEAWRVGLVQRRADDARVAAQALATDIAALAPLSVKGHKRMLNRVGDASALSGGDLRDFADLELAAFQSEDVQEGLAAFSEKRQPRFGGT
jgi:enoyl-CoA hydratase/carnithine racemase